MRASWVWKDNWKYQIETFFELKTPWFGVKHDLEKIITLITSLHWQFDNIEFIDDSITLAVGDISKVGRSIPKSRFFSEKHKFCKANLSLEDHVIGRKCSRSFVFALTLLFKNLTVFIEVVWKKRSQSRLERVARSQLMPFL